MKFRFNANIVVEASSEEDALAKIGARIGAIQRHLGNGEKLARTDPFFTLTETDRGDPVDLTADPIVAKRLAAEAEPKPLEE